MLYSRVFIDYAYISVKTFKIKSSKLYCVFKGKLLDKVIYGMPPSLLISNRFTVTNILSLVYETMGEESLP